MLNYEKPVTLDFTTEDFEGKRFKEDDEYDVDDMKDKIQTRTKLVYG